MRYKWSATSGSAPPDLRTHFFVGLLFVFKLNRYNALFDQLKLNESRTQPASQTGRRASRRRIMLRAPPQTSPEKGRLYLITPLSVTGPYAHRFVNIFRFTGAVDAHLPTEQGNLQERDNDK